MERVIGQYAGVGQMVGIKSLKNKHKNKTIYIVGSGGSLSFINPNFFKDKLSIAVNYAGRVHGFSPTYLFSHYHEDTKINLDAESIGVTLEFDTNTKSSWLGEKPDNLYFTPMSYIDPPGSSWSPYINPTPDDGLVYGSSSIHGAMHLGAYLGAKYLVLVGVDCGILDGQHRIKDYPTGHTPWAIYEAHNRQLKAWLKEKYKVEIYSLNPFINFNLEGHTFQGA